MKLRRVSLIKWANAINFAIADEKKTPVLLFFILKKGFFSKKDPF